MEIRKMPLNSHKQHTLAKPTEIIEGIGLYTAASVFIRIEPADVGHGVCFIRSDADTRYEIPATFRNVDAEASQGYTLLKSKYPGEHIQTPEHWMAALAACGIDNANVVFVGPGHELSLLDGGSRQIIDAIRKAGVVTQDAPRERIRILKKVRVEDGKGRYAEIAPTDGDTLKVHFKTEVPAIVGGRPGLGSLSYDFELGRDDFYKDIAGCRTFTRYSFADSMIKNGMKLGGTPKNVRVICDDARNLDTYGKPYVGMFDGHYYGPHVNDGDFMEPVKHKVLDAVGDLAMAGHPIAGLYESNGGHSLNNQLLRAVFADPRAYIFERIDAPMARVIELPRTAPRAGALMDATAFN